MITNQHLSLRCSANYIFATVGVSMVVSCHLPLHKHCPIYIVPSPNLNQTRECGPKAAIFFHVVISLPQCPGFSLIVTIKSLSFDLPQISKDFLDKSTSSLSHTPKDSDGDEALPSSFRLIFI